MIEFAESTRTSQEAADAVGTSVAQIAKSLVFMAGEEFILVIASGKNRVNEKKLKALVGVKIKKAHPDRVREATGYAIGGIPPVGHSTPLRTFIDEDLLTYPQIFAAAGTPHAVFEVKPDDLVSITQGEVVDIKE